MKTLLADHAVALAQGRALLAVISDEDYRRPDPGCYGSSIGGHFRHVIDHYDCLLRDVGSGLIRYDHRARSPLLEGSRQVAEAALEDRREALQLLAGLPAEMPLAVELDTGSGAAPAQASSLGRELQFVLSHTIHHYALIGVVCLHRQIPLPEDFGVAPSTILARLAVAS